MDKQRVINIAPSILSGDFSRIDEEVSKVERAGADLIHLDVMDGHFVPNITFGPKMVADIRKITDMPLDVHLMICNPEKYADKFIAAGADYITIHAEATNEPAKLLEKIKKNGIKCGLAISPDTLVKSIAEYVSLCDLILIMSVYPGFSGQKYIEGSDKKIAEVKELILKCGNNAVIEVDGGINLSNAATVFNAGADILVTGNTFFNEQNPGDVVKAIKHICSCRE